MVDFFYYLYSDVLGHGNASLFGIRYKSVFRELLRVTTNIFVPLFYILSPTPSLPKTKRKRQIILSLTSFPARIGRVRIVIESLLRQQEKADRIILWLSKDQFEGIALPKRLLRLQEKGLEICFVDGDIRSHKKYYYTLKQYPEDVLVTVDDDLYYRTTFLRDLLSAHEQNTKAVISCYAFKIGYDKDGRVLPYQEWKQPVASGVYPSGVIFFGSGGGTLFPPHSLHPDVLKIETARSLCPLADDVWLNAMCQMNDVDVVKVEGNNLLLSVYTESMNKTETLCSVNVGGNMNDVQIKRVMEHYPLTYKRAGIM